MFDYGYDFKEFGAVDFSEIDESMFDYVEVEDFEIDFE